MASGAVTTKTVYGTSQLNTLYLEPASSKSIFIWNCVITNTESGMTRIRLASTRKVITGATQDDPCQLTITGHGYSVGDLITIGEVVGMTELNGNEYRVGSVVDANNITLEVWDPDADPDPAYVDLDSTGFTAYSSGGNAYVGEGIATLDSIGTAGLNGINIEGGIDEDIEITCPANTTIVTLTDDLS